MQGWTTINLRTIDKDHLKRLAQESRPRPILRLGTEADTDHPDWSLYLQGAVTLSGVFNPRRHGVWSLYGVGTNWVGDHLYRVPQERRAVDAWPPTDEDLVNLRDCLLPRMSWRMARNAEAVIDDAEGEDVNGEWEFPGDEEDPRQVACVSAALGYRRLAYEEERRREAVEQALEYNVGERTVPADAWNDLVTPQPPGDPEESLQKVEGS